MQQRFAQILSVGTAVPDNVVTNNDLARMLNTSDDWIATRTGIRERRISPRDNPVSATGLGTEAAKKALDKAGIAASEVVVEEAESNSNHEAED